MIAMANALKPWNVERLCARHTAVLWWAWVVAMGASIATAWIASHDIHQSRRAADKITASIEHLRHTATASKPAAPDSMRDFTALLGPPARDSDLLQVLEQACASAGVTIASVQLARHDAKADQLGRLELTTSLRGPSMAARQVVKELSEGFANVTVSRLAMRRSAVPGQIETQLVLTAWSAPLVGADR